MFYRLTRAKSLVQFDTCQKKIFTIWHLSTKMMYSMTLVTSSTFHKKVGTLQHVLIWTRVTGNVLQRETCQSGQVSKETLVNMTRANLERVG